MKLLRKPIEMIASFDCEGNSRPLKFRISNEDQENQVIQVQRVITKELDQFAGNKMLKYTCEACMEGAQKQFELRYELDTCKWFLYKM